MVLNCGILALAVTDEGRIDLRVSDGSQMHLKSLRPVARIDGEDLHPTACRLETHGQTAWTWHFGDRMRLRVIAQKSGASGIALRPVLEYIGSEPVTLNRVTLFETDGNGLELGAPDAVRIFEQGNYWGRVRPLRESRETQNAPDQAEPVELPRRTSDLVWVAYDRAAKRGLLVGFLSSERWLGQVELQMNREGNPSQWRAGFDGGDLHLAPGQILELEDMLLLAGPDPWTLLETYADAVRERHRPEMLDAPPVSWCSWYPYRLSVSADRVLENARAAAKRLKPLGLKIFEVDLGWERDHLPGAFEENERFPNGLRGLADELETLEFELGVWKAPYTISEFDPMAKAHPDWLIGDDSGNPARYWTWYWEPYGKVFILDLTRPESQQWLREKISSLHARGVRYFKADFIGCASHPIARNRHDKTVVMGGGLEAARIGARIIQEALPNAKLLNCGGAEMPGTGHWPLLYTCNDTGNTGFIDPAFQQANHLSLACHLFKNRRWGIVQPSCLCVGLPGSLEEARQRATAAFLAGGQIDIGDTLTTLPEDRWQVLTATLPPLGKSARPVDLFDPLYDDGAFDYSPSYKNGDRPLKELPPGSVWHLQVETDWDRWDLVGLFAFADPESGKPQITRFSVPFSMLGLPETETRWAYEFWSGQFLGAAPTRRINANGYGHPGDVQDLLVGNKPGVLDVAFFGPGVKLLCLRKPKPHPWVLGTSFHQSGGAELQHVQWHAQTRTLSGELHRPAGQMGFIALAGADHIPESSHVGDQSASPQRGANGAWILPVVTCEDVTPWRVRFREITQGVASD